LGRILQQARLVSGLSQRELADRLGTTQRYVWEMEAGKPSIFVDRLFAVMRETGMELTATIPNEVVLPAPVRKRRACATCACKEEDSPTAAAGDDDSAASLLAGRTRRGARNTGGNRGHAHPHHSDRLT